MKAKKVILLTAILLIMLTARTAEAKSMGEWTSQLSPQGSSFTTLLDGRLEFILMDGWKLSRRNLFEYIITKDINGVEKEIGGIEVLTRDRSSSPSKIFTTLKDSGGSYILIEDKMVEKTRHSQYHIKWIKDKKYYVDVYVMNAGATSYHITLTTELQYFEKVYQQFEDFLNTLDIREFLVDTQMMGYYNNVDKYLVYIPQGWSVDNSKEFANTTFSKPGTGKLYIYKQELDGVSPNTYMWYSNKKIFEGTGGVQLIYRRDIEDNGARLVEYMWRRPGIENYEEDYNYYWEINIIPENQDYLYTFIMKTDKENMDEAFQAYQGILSSFYPIDYNIYVKPRSNDTPEEVHEINIEGNKMHLNIPKDKTLWGIFSEHTPGDYLNSLKEVDKLIGRKLEFVMTYSSFDSDFPENDVKEIYNDGRIMMLTLHPWSYGNTDDILIPKIIEGKYDDYIKRWAEKTKELGEPVFIRFANEMNGDWDQWCAWFYGKDHDLFIEAWRHVYNIFKEAGATNAYFVWNPHDRSYPNFKWNNPHLYYPGDEYVDWIGLTGYNNGTSHPGDQWREFDDIYNDIYYEYSSLYPEKPLMITEFSSNEVGGDKEEWIKRTFEKLAQKYQRIRIAVWFNQMDGKWEYPINSTPAAREAFVNGINNERYNFDAVK
ncbi:MAG: hypothetical protein HPY66_3167 [Firmicutes bacterium]|nr:hypothetical protein [Bacillota bacterium]